MIIELVNELFGSLPDRASTHPYARPIARWCRRFRPHSTARRESGHVTIRSVASRDDPRASITATADLVQELHVRHPAASLGVLVLKNETVAELMFALRQRGLAASEEGGQPLTDSAAVQLILSMLWLTEHPGDSVAQFHVAHSDLGPAVGIQPSNWQNAMEVAQRAAQWRRRLFERGLGGVIEDWTRILRPACSSHEWRRLQQLIDQAFEADRRKWTSVAPFVLRLRRLRVGAPAATDIRVMTVHKSKGLQFDIVVLTGLDRKLVDPPTLAFRRDAETHEVDRVVRYCNQKVQEILPAQVRQTCQATIDQLVEERLSVLYVAVTRAQRAVHVVMLESNRPHGEASSLAGLLRVALAGPTSPASGIWWERGSPDWQLSPAATAPRSVCGSTPSDLPTAPVGPAAQGHPSRRREFVSPSRLEGQTTVAVARLFDRQRSAALQVGTVVHRVLEQITWWTAELDSTSALRVLCHTCGGRSADEQADAWADRLVTWLRGESVQQVLCEDRYRACILARAPQSADVILSVRTEQSLAAEVNQVWLSGVVDRLVLATADSGLLWAHVIDYKTDQLPPDDPATLAERVEFYRPQLQAYRSMVSAALRLPPERVLADLCFVPANHLVPID